MGVLRSREPFKFWWAPTISLELESSCAQIFQVCQLYREPTDTIIDRRGCDKIERTKVEEASTHKSAKTHAGNVFFVD